MIKGILIGFLSFLFLSSAFAGDISTKDLMGKYRYTADQGGTVELWIGPPVDRHGIYYNLRGDISIQVHKYNLNEPRKTGTAVTTRVNKLGKKLGHKVGDSSVISYRESDLVFYENCKPTSEDSYVYIKPDSKSGLQKMVLDCVNSVVTIFISKAEKHIYLYNSTTITKKSEIPYLKKAYKSDDLSRFFRDSLVTYNAEQAYQPIDPWGCYDESYKVPSDVECSGELLNEFDRL